MPDVDILGEGAQATWTEPEEWESPFGTVQRQTREYNPAFAKGVDILRNMGLPMEKALAFMPALQTQTPIDLARDITKGTGIQVNPFQIQTVGSQRGFEFPSLHAPTTTPTTTSKPSDVYWEGGNWFKWDGGRRTPFTSIEIANLYKSATSIVPYQYKGNSGFMYYIPSEKTGGTAQRDVYLWAPHAKPSEVERLDLTHYVDQATGRILDEKEVAKFAEIKDITNQLRDLSSLYDKGISDKPSIDKANALFNKAIELAYGKNIEYQPTENIRGLYNYVASAIPVPNIVPVSGTAQPIHPTEIGVRRGWSGANIQSPFYQGHGGGQLAMGAPAVSPGWASGGAHAAGSAPFTQR